MKHTATIVLTTIGIILTIFTFASIYIVEANKKIVIDSTIDLMHENLHLKKSQVNKEIEAYAKHANITSDEVVTRDAFWAKLYDRQLDGTSFLGRTIALVDQDLNVMYQGDHPYDCYLQNDNLEDFRVCYPQDDFPAQLEEAFAKIKNGISGLDRINYPVYAKPNSYFWVMWEIIPDDNNSLDDKHWALIYTVPEDRMLEAINNTSDQLSYLFVTFSFSVLAVPYITLKLQRRNGVRTSSNNSGSRK